MTTQDMWSSMGFPICKRAIEAVHGATCQFSRTRRGPKTRTRRSQSNQVGNTMHVNFMSAIQMLLILKLQFLGERDEAPVPEGADQSSSTPSTSSPSTPGDSASESDASSSGFCMFFARVRRLAQPSQTHVSL